MRGFLNAVLTDFGAPLITEAKVLNPFNIKQFAADKGTIIDVRVLDEAMRQYNVEVQTALHTGFVNRTLLYWATSYSGMLRSGNDYTKLVPVRSIILTGFPIFPELKNLHTVFEARSRENPNVRLTDHFQMHFLRLGDMLKRQMAGLSDLDRSLQHWMNFFAFGDTLSEDKMSQLVDNDSLVKQAYQEFQRFTADDEMREKVRQRQLFLDEQRVYIDAARDEGEARGKAEGEAKTILTVLRARFRKVPKGVENAVRSMTDATALESLAIHAATCESLEDFSEALK